MRSLIRATSELIVTEGTHVSVRQVAERANVNHGLVHTYFGNKARLISAAFDDINRRASQDRNPDGFPPPDLASRRDGELAKAIARIRLDDQEMADPFSSHPIATSWQAALNRTRPDLNATEVDTMVAAAAALGLGWALFADYLCAVLQLDDERRDDLVEHINRLVAELGGLPEPAQEEPR